MRIHPRPALAWAIGIGYMLLFLGLEAIMGVDYDTIGTTTDRVCTRSSATPRRSRVTIGAGW
jgi:hypothetical protein